MPQERFVQIAADGGYQLSRDFESLTTAFFNGPLDVVGSGSLAGRAAFNASAVGAVYVDTDEDPWEFYIHTAAGDNWSGPQTFRDDTGVAALRAEIVDDFLGGDEGLAVDTAAALSGLSGSFSGFESDVAAVQAGIAALAGPTVARFPLLADLLAASLSSDVDFVEVVESRKRYRVVALEPSDGVDYIEIADGKFLESVDSRDAVEFWPATGTVVEYESGNKYNVFRGSLVVLSETGLSHHGGMRPLLWVKDDKRGQPRDGVQRGPSDGDGLFKTYVADGLTIRVGNDTGDFNIDRYEFDVGTDEWLEPDAGITIGRIYPRLWKLYDVGSGGDPVWSFLHAEGTGNARPVELLLRQTTADGAGEYLFRVTEAGGDGDSTPLDTARLGVVDRVTKNTPWRWTLNNEVGGVAEALIKFGRFDELPADAQVIYVSGIGSIGGQMKMTIVADSDSRTITAAECGKFFHQPAAAAGVPSIFTLPAWASGLFYHFVCTDVDGIQVIRAGSDTIRDGASSDVTSLSSTVIGSFLTLRAFANNRWMVTDKNGTWT